jgi:GNAT superfamily N-acetyltransferase
MRVKTTYLEMLARPERVVPPPREGLAVVHAQRPTVADYRSLYDAVGRDYDWTSRRKLSGAELAALLNDPRDEVHVLLVDGVPAGFAELDRRAEGEVELVQFGLMPEFIGQGLGRYFLQWAIDKAWSYNPVRFWLHTCTRDHPAALPNYLKAGFTVYKVEVKDRG